jgi:DMSO/TMAO reductase YedYZ molybdopterin-dependent catalytic subunit
MKRNRLKVSPEALARRRFLQRALGGSGAAVLGGCDRLNASPVFADLLSAGEVLSLSVRTAVGAAGQTMAQEFTKDDLSPTFRGNGNTNPDSDEYKAMAASGFADWKLVVDGLVEAPTTFTLAALRAMPARTQITRHDCVEGWSAIGQWTGVPLSAVLNMVKPKAAAKYVVFHCADSFEGEEEDQPYYESIDLQDAQHPQTLLAYELNDQTLPIINGAPLRLRVERQLGYKQAKYIMRLELVDDFSRIAGGKGGYWEDQGYQWYAGI